MSAPVAAIEGSELKVLPIIPAKSGISRAF
jgi:hypothetical protein